MRKSFPSAWSKLLAILLFVSASSSGAFAQHCSDVSVPDNNSYSKIRSGGGFTGSYALPCVAIGQYTEIEVPFKVFNTVPHGNADDTVYQMRIEQITNLPEGMCWLSSKADNTFAKGEGGRLVFRGITNDNAGQYVLAVTVSFDTNGSGAFNRPNVNYNKVSNTGRMILRVTTDANQCADIDYDLASNIAGAGPNTAAKQ